MSQAKPACKANDECGDEPLVTAGPASRRQADEQARQRLDQLLLDGLNSGAPIVVDKRYWAVQKAKLKRRLSASKQAQGALGGHGQRRRPGGD